MRAAATPGDVLLQNYRELCEAVHMIREAVETAFGLGVLPKRRAYRRYTGQDCEAIVRAIHAAADRKR
jgi:hypothetical protein